MAVEETKEAKVAVADKAEVATTTAGEMTTGILLDLMEGQSTPTLPISLITTNGSIYLRKLGNNSFSYAENTGIEKGQGIMLMTREVNVG